LDIALQLVDFTPELGDIVDRDTEERLMTRGTRPATRHSDSHRRRRGCLLPYAAFTLLFAIAGCAHNPALGKWNIGKREKEVVASDVDELTHNIRTSTGATSIEFRKNSILISGGAQDHVESGVQYSVQQLEGGAIDVRILQPRKGDSSADIDVLHIASDGNTAQLESRTELVDLTRATH
jgi:hypothetical protein